MSEKWKRASEFIDNWVDAGDSLGETDWRTGVRERMAEGDVDGMKEAASASAQWNLIKLAHESKSDQLRFQALTFLLGQAGHGVVQKVDKKISYDQLPADQLLSILRSKLSKLSELVPGFDPSMVLEAEVSIEDENETEQATQPPLMLNSAEEDDE